MNKLKTLVLSLVVTMLLTLFVGSSVTANRTQSSFANIVGTDTIVDPRLGITLNLPNQMFANVPDELSQISIVTIYASHPTDSQSVSNKLEIAVEAIPEQLSVEAWQELQPKANELFKVKAIARHPIEVADKQWEYQKVTLVGDTVFYELNVFINRTVFHFASSNFALFETILDSIQLEETSQIPPNVSLLRPPDTGAQTRGMPELKFPFLGTKQVTCAYHVDDSNCHAITKWALDFNLSYDSVLAAHSGHATNHFQACVGNYIIVTDVQDSSYHTLYGHLSSIVKTGSVSQMDEIAVSGETGTCQTGPHLHFYLKHQSLIIKPEPMCGVTGFLRYQTHSDCWNDQSSCESPSTTFCDVPTDHSFYTEIEALYAAGLTNGCRTEDDGRKYYCPGDLVNRPNAAKFVGRWLYRYQAVEAQTILPPTTGFFADFQGDGEGERIVEMLHRDGVIRGYSDGDFKPDRYVSRQEFTYMVMRILLKHSDPSVDSSSCSFPDTQDEMVRAACDLGIINGYSDGTFKPDLGIDRGQLAAVLSRAFLAATSNSELNALRNAARVNSHPGSICFTAAANAAGSNLPGLVITHDGMEACYWYISQSYLPYTISNSGSEYRTSPFDHNDVEYCEDVAQPILSGEVIKSNDDIYFRIGKCDGSRFQYSGEAQLMVDGSELTGAIVSYTANDRYASISFDPVLVDLTGVHYYSARVQSANNDPGDYINTLAVAVWDFDAQNEPEYKYEEESRHFECLDILEVRLNPNDGRNTLEVELQKCDGSDFGQDGRYWILLNNQRKWGPFYYQAGERRLGVDVDIYGEEGNTSNNSYKIELYSDDQPNDPKYTPSIRAQVEIEQLPDCVTLDLDSEPLVAGGVTASIPPNCGGNKYLAGTTLTLTPHVSFDQYLFAHWEGDVSRGAGNGTITLNSNEDVTAALLVQAADIGRGRAIVKFINRYS